MLGWLDSWRDSEWRDGALGITGGGYSELSGGGRFGITRRSVRDDGEGRPLGTPLRGRVCAGIMVEVCGLIGEGDHKGRPYGNVGWALIGEEATRDVPTREGVGFGIGRC